MLKAAGIVMILLVGGSLSWSATTAMRQRLSVLSAWIRLLNTLRLQIDCFSIPVNDILKTADRELLAVLGYTAEGATLAGLYQSSCSALDRDAQRVICELIDAMGCSRRADEIKRLDTCISALEEQHKRLTKALPQKIKTYATLYASASLGIAILLW